MAITTNNLISRQTVGSAGAASITFSNIPQTFTDLRIVVSGRTDYANSSDEVYLKLNGSSASIYSWKMLYGTGSAAASVSDSAEGYGIAGVQIDGSTATASVFSNGEIYIPNYTSANYKSISMEHCPETNAAAINMKMVAGLWSSTAAITSLSLSGGTGNFVQYSTFSLYGISSNTSTQNTSVPSATGGDVITTDGTYWYHAFKASGTFTPLKTLTADCLVVAGGGGGAGDRGGGGGAGGLVYSASNSLTTTGYVVTIGAGGAGGDATRSLSTGRGTNGSNSNVTGGSLSLTAAVGGGGGGTLGIGDTDGRNNGKNGGSGGGAGGAAGGNAGTVGTATSGQGNNGGSGYTGGESYSAGAGGGAGAVGGNGSSASGGAGGGGSSTYSSWGSATSTGQNVSGTYYYAGGGGGGSYSASGGAGGAGGNGGGGAGTGTQTGNSASSNTGGGGGGAGSGGSPNTGGGTGGSGIVIVRYTV